MCNPGPGAVIPWITLQPCNVLLMRTGMLVLQTSNPRSEAIGDYYFKMMGVTGDSK